MNAEKGIGVYGIGNALLDMEFQVTDEVLTALKIEKGVMTLIDEQQHHTLLDELQGISHGTASGGSVANSIVTVSQMGVPAYMACRVAQDQAGDHYFNNLQEAKVGNRFEKNTRVQGHTGKCLAFITPDCERSMYSYLGVSADFCQEDIDVEALKQAELLYVEGYLVASPVSMQAILFALKVAREHGVRVALSLSDVNMVKFFREQIDAILQEGVDILFANDQEAALYVGSNERAEQQKELLNYAHQVVITQGKNGSIVCNAEDCFEVAAVPVDVVDSLGAGDAFAGAYLASFIQGQDIKTCANAASYVAGCIVAKVGPRFSQEEMDIIKKDLKHTHSV